MVKVDECGCVVNRIYASDYLSKRLYTLKGRGFSLVKRVELDNERWFEIYRKGNEIRYKSSECPLVIIGLEALLEAWEDGKLKQGNWVDVLRNVKGLQLNTVLEKLGASLMEVLSHEEGRLYS
ncbi:hypothetical protein GWK48_07035 [Metallosphaera tengchongensis]|uniref:Uncharacterized protein n=1 Tax=Metallosphaera tengchongensis TaxID=1532350 RepID=A0A6N0NXQ9_9CREN|nr:hypothetical protein [Metallosphaera tengchongensis]QKR00158.1 hypothetical protein GWK48_07035 [Metallosphaera tengchongensis]